MSNIESNIIDPGRSIPPPGQIPPQGDPDVGLVDDDAIREPDADIPAIEPDPEEGRRDLPDIHRARHRKTSLAQADGLTIGKRGKNKPRPDGPTTDELAG